MEAIKNILKPGKATDDEILYGSGKSNDPVHSGNTGVLTGEGSHLNNSQDTPGSVGLGNSSTGNATTTAGPHSTDIANKADPRVESNLDGSQRTGDSTGVYGSTSQSTMPGAFESSSSPYGTQGVGGPTATSGLGSSTTGTGHDSTGQQTGYASQRTTGTSDSHLGRDTAAVGTAGVVGEGIHHHREIERGNLGASAGTPGSYGDNTGVGNTSSNTTTGPHSSNLVNKLDPRVDSNNSKTADNTSSGPHYGRDAAAVGGAAAVGEGIHHHHENQRETLGSSGYSGTTPSGAGSAYYGGPAGTAVSEVPGPHSTSTANRLDPAIHHDGQPIEEAHQRDLVIGGGGVAADEGRGSGRHHLARDAAVGAGGVGLTEHEHRKHEREREAGVGSTTGIGSNTDAHGDKSIHGHTTGTTEGPHKSSLLSKLDPRTDSASGTVDNAGSGHHHGRDAAAGAGAVGIAEHEHRKHERERETGVGSNTGVGSSTGAHDIDHSRTATTDTSGHHYGRDATIGAGGAGLVEHEHRKHEHERQAGLGSNTGGTNATVSGTGPAPNTAGPHSKDWMNKLDPRVNSNPDTAETGLTGTHGQSHGARDAAAGAGLVGAAGYEAEKHHAARNGPGVGGTYDESLPNFHHTGKDASAVGAATALDESEKTRLRAARGEHDNNYNQGALESGIGSNTTGTVHDSGLHDPGYKSNLTGPAHEQSRDHHLGRDAAGAGVVGGAAYEAEKHHKHDKDLTAAEREQKRELKHEEKEAKREQKEEKKHHGLLSFLHRDKSKKYTKEEEEEFDRQEREHHSHAGRDAAIGGAAVGGAAYETGKQHGHHHTTAGESDTMKPLPVAPGNNGVGTGEGTQNALVMDRKRGEGYDVDTTAGTGHPHGEGTDAYQPPGTTIGDKLHGVERNRGVNDGSTGAGYDTTTGTHHYGRDATIGAGGVGLAEHEHRKHEEERAADVGSTNPTTTGKTGTSSGIGYGVDDPVTSMLGANTQAERSAGYAAPTAAPRNVLHKDPPANHPAARAMAGESTHPQDTTGSSNY